jgi:hypothetical protein
MIGNVDKMKGKRQRIEIAAAMNQNSEGIHAFFK